MVDDTVCEICVEIGVGLCVPSTDLMFRYGQPLAPHRVCMAGVFLRAPMITPQLRWRFNRRALDAIRHSIHI